MTEEEYQELIRLGADNEEIMQAIKLQMEQAEQIRPGALQMRQPRGIPVAPTAFEGIANVAQNYMSNKVQGDAQKNVGKMSQNTQLQNSAILKAILAQQQQKAPAPVAGSGMQPPGQPNPYQLGGM